MAKNTSSKDLFAGIKPVKPASAEKKTKTEPKTSVKIKEETTTENLEVKVEPLTEKKYIAEKKQESPKKVGRPSRQYDVSKKTIYFPTSLLEQMEAAPLKIYQGDLAKYICSLVEKDLKDNEGIYETFKSINPKMPKSML